MHSVCRLKRADGNSLWPDLALFFYTLVTSYVGKGLAKCMGTACTEGVKPMHFFPFSSCALVAKQQHFNCDWYKQLGCNGNLSHRFKPSFYCCNLQLGWLLALLLFGRERKETKQIGGFSFFLFSLVQSVAQGIALEFVSLFFLHRN